MANPKKPEQAEIFLRPVEWGTYTFFICGITPLICNRMSEKALRELLLPRGRKNAADKASTLKHDPLAEYRASPYCAKGDNVPTRLQLLSSMFKGAMRITALDLPDSSARQIGRLVQVVGDRVDVYGVPQLMMSVTRMRDMARTPDVRSRAILPKWACKISVRFVQPLLRQQSIVNLVSASGMTSGVGDWRSEKGSGSYGSFRVCNADDAEYLQIVKTGGRAAQDVALRDPQCYDDESESLLSWYTTEVKARGFRPADFAVEDADRAPIVRELAQQVRSRRKRKAEEPADEAPVELAAARAKRKGRRVNGGKEAA